MGARPGAVDVIEQAYRLDLEDGQWLRELTDVIEPLLGPEAGTVSYYFDLVGPRTQLAHTYVKNAALTRPMQEATAFSDPAQRAILMHSTPVNVLSKLLPPAHYRAWRATSGKEMGIVDSLGVCALDPDGKGLVLSIGALRRLTLEPKRRESLVRVATHIGAAFRLRRQLAGLAASDVLEGADAILDASGACAHARGGAKPADARELLRRAAKAVDHARSRKGRQDPDRSMAAWKGLVDGRWSVVDQFDSDGRRYWVAQRNAPHAPDPRRLTQMERRVVTYAAMGQSQKEIAYTLGVSIGTVGNHLRSGLKKLGMKSRVELVRFFSDLWLRQAMRAES